MRKAKDPDLPDALRKIPDRLGRKALASVSRCAAYRRGAMGVSRVARSGWAGTTRFHVRKPDAGRSWFA